MSVPNLYPQEIRCEINGFFTYVPVSATGTYSIVNLPLPSHPPYLFQDIGGVINGNTGVISIKSPVALEPTLFQITGPTNTDISTFYITVFQSLNNNLWFSAFVGSQALDPSYNALPPPEYDYSYNLTSSAAPGDTGAIAPYSTTLPPGMTLSESSGVFQGTFTFFSIWPFTTYNVMVSNALKGTSWTQVSLAVDISPVFTYTDSPYLALPGEAVSIEPTIGTGAIGVIYFVSPQSPALPNGLTLNSSTAVISGIPAANSVSSNTYTIVAQTSSGSPVGRYETTLVINVNIPPSFLYPFSPYVLIQNIYAAIVPEIVIQSPSPLPLPLVNSTTSLAYVSNPKVINECVTTNGPAACYIGNSTLLYIGGSTNLQKIKFEYPSDIWSFNSVSEQWTSISVTNAPPGRQFATVAFNSNTQKVYLFGGFNVFIPLIIPVVPPVYTFYNDLWEYDIVTQSWSIITVSGNVPAARAFSSLVYDDTTNELILFGGFYFDQTFVPTYYNDTLRFNCTTKVWSLLTLLINPPPMYTQSMVQYKLSKFRLYGGRGAGGYFNGLWEFNNNSALWTVISANGSVGNPPQNDYSSMIYDSINDYTVVNILGADFNTPSTTYIYVGDVIGYWQQIFPTIVPSYTQYFPETQYVPLVYIPDDGKTVLCANKWTGVGERTTGIPQTGIFTSNGSLQSQWRYIPETYPAANGDIPYAYNPDLNEAMIINDKETWIYHCESNIWTQVYTAFLPAFIEGSSMVYVNSMHTYMIIAKYSTVTTVFVFNLNTQNWVIASTLGSLPLPRINAAAVYDISHNRIVYYGGFNTYNGLTSYSDTWLFNPSTLTWTQVNPLLNRYPSQRGLCGATYDIDQEKVMLFGGSNLPPYSYLTASFTLYNDMWSFDIPTLAWIELIPNMIAGSPQARIGPGMVYDSTAKQTILYGGYGDPNVFTFISPYLNDTWAFSYASNGTINKWQNLNPGNPPEAVSWPQVTLYVPPGHGFTGVIVMYLIIYQDTIWLLQPVAPIPAPDVPFNVLYTKCEPVNQPDYTAFPPLPYGLTLDPTTGIISGIPTVLQGPHVYSITGTNDAGTFTTSLIISVVRPYTGGRDFGYCYDQIPDFEMRHKATVLQYKKNAAGFTKKQLWSQAVRGNGQYAKRTWGTQSVDYANPNFNGLPLQDNRLLCPSNPVICQPTYNSDVPGPVMQLCENTTLPPVNVLPHRQLTLNGTKWPQTQWSPQRGGNGFPRGKAGSGFFFFK